MWQPIGVIVSVASILAASPSNGHRLLDLSGKTCEELS